MGVSVARIDCFVVFRPPGNPNSPQTPRVAAAIACQAEGQIDINIPELVDFWGVVEDGGLAFG